MRTASSVRFFLVAFAISVSFVLATDVSAAYIYTLQFDKTFYLVDPGGSVTVNLSLREEVTDGYIPRLDASHGLTFGNVQVNKSGGASIDSATANSGTGRFGFTFSPTIHSTDVQFNQNDFGGTGAIGAVVSPTIREVSLGTVTFSVPINSSSTNISFSDWNLNANDTDISINTGGGGTSLFPLDAIVFPTAGTARIANPEPSTFILTGMGILGSAVICHFRRRRMKSDKVSDSPAATA